MRVSSAEETLLLERRGGRPETGERLGSLKVGKGELENHLME